MAPKKSKKKEQKELTVDDMRRLGMSEEDIARITAERGKSSEDKKAEQKQEEERRRETEARQRAHREHLQKIEALIVEEGKPRVAIVEEEEQAWAAMEPELTAEKDRRLRVFFEKEVIRKTAEAKKRAAEEAAAYEARVSGMSAEEREKLVAEAIERERQRTAEVVASEEKRLAREERREKRRLARLERGKINEGEFMDDSSSGDDDQKVKAKRNASKNMIISANGVDADAMERLQDKYD